MAEPPLMSRRALTDDQLLAIGCLVYEAARLEALFAEVARERLHAAVADALFAGGRTLRARLDKLKQVMPAITEDGALQDEFAALVADLIPDVKTRNVIVHGRWDEPEPVVSWKGYLLDLFRPDRDASVEGKEEKLRASEIIALAHRFAGHHRRLEDWCSRLSATPAT